VGGDDDDYRHIQQPEDTSEAGTKLTFESRTTSDDDLPNLSVSLPPKLELYS
jgi:hypothetical protein